MTPSPIGFYLGDFSNNHFGELVLEVDYIRTWGIITGRRIHKHESLNLHLLPLDVDFSVQAIKSVH